MPFRQATDFQLLNWGHLKLHLKALIALGGKSCFLDNDYYYLQSLNEEKGGSTVSRNKFQLRRGNHFPFVCTDVIKNNNQKVVFNRKDIEASCTAAPTVKITKSV